MWDAGTARTSVKRRLDIPEDNTDFDDLIDEFVQSGVLRLYPIAQREVTPQNVNVTVDSFGETTVNLSMLPYPVQTARKVEQRDPSGLLLSATEYTHHGANLTVRELSSEISVLRIYGLAEFELASVPGYLQQAVIWYALSEFFDMLAGNQRKYNIYVQSTGARAVDNMRDESQFYEEKANAYLNDRAQLHGVS